jgi:metal-dependent HD superfamily phosphatase/phosphodiesterase
VLLLIQLSLSPFHFHRKCTFLLSLSLSRKLCYFAKKKKISSLSIHQLQIRRERKQENNPIQIVSKKKKNLGINQIQEVKDVYNENYKIQEIEKDTKMKRPPMFMD